MEEGGREWVGRRRGEWVGRWEEGVGWEEVGSLRCPCPRPPPLGQGRAGHENDPAKTRDRTPFLTE